MITEDMNLDSFGIPIFERNVVNVSDVDQFVSSMKTGDQKIDSWLKGNLRKYIINDYEEVENYRAKPTDPDWMKRSDDLVKVKKIRNDFKDKINHVIDYFKSNDAPKELTRITVKDAIKKSEDWVKQLTKGKVADVVPGEEVVKEYSDGFRWIELKSKEALNREGQLMGHCVGSYCERVSSGVTNIYSLRDSKNLPHATVEVSGEEIEQIKGKGNKEVVEKYHKYVEDFIESMGFELGSGGEEDLSKAGLIMINGKRYSISNPDSWPKEISGDLDLADTPIKSLPDGLEVGGGLDLSDTPLSKKWNDSMKPKEVRGMVIT